MNRFTLSRVALLGLTALLAAPATKADPVYKRTEVTFSQPVEIPGMVLMPGKYVMKLLDPFTTRNVVRFYNAEENHMYAMVFAIPDYRVTATDHTVLTFEERAHNSPQALKEWFPAGENWGEEFVYPKARTVAAAVSPATPQAAETKSAAIAPVKPAETPAPTARVEPKPAPIEIAQAQPTPAPAKTAAPAPEQKKELPKTASELPAFALLGGLLTLAGAILRRRSA